MGKRHVPIIHEDKDGLVYTACNCGQNSGPNHFTRLEKWKAEDWQRQHLESVQHALAVLHRGRGSLKIDMKHAERMLADPTVTPRDKASWQVIYEGARQRLGQPLEDPDVEGLW